MFNKSKFSTGQEVTYLGIRAIITRAEYSISSDATIYSLSVYRESGRTCVSGCFDHDINS
jgi:hypothetical protein